MNGRELQRETYESAGKYHESHIDQVAELLRRGALTKLYFENRHKGSRLAPAIERLRNELNWEIEGHGTQDDPYRLINEGLDTSELLDAKLQKIARERYWQTRHWIAVREKRLRTDDYRCSRCKSEEELQVHHWKYELFAESNEDLMTLCRSCHEWIHKQKGIRIAFPRVTREIKFRIDSQIDEPVRMEPREHVQGVLFEEKNPNGSNAI